MVAETVPVRLCVVVRDSDWVGSFAVIPGPCPVVAVCLVLCGPLGVTSLDGGNILVRVETDTSFGPVVGPSGMTGVTLGDRVLISTSTEEVEMIVAVVIGSGVNISVIEKLCRGEMDGSMSMGGTMG